MKKRKRILALLLLGVMIFSVIPIAYAAQTQRRIVRVAFPEQPGMSQVGHTGKLTGYNYDYLEKISEFTGWQMEYVFYESEDSNEAIRNAMEDLQNGKVDLLGPMLKTDETEEMFQYPQTSYGTVYTTLCADVNNALYKSGLNPSQVLQIGLLETAETRNGEVLDFLKRENIAYQLHYYSTDQEQEAALHSGEVDLISGLSLSPVIDTRIVAKFAARPYYFAATKGNTQLVDQLDKAMEQIHELQPELQEHLFNEYFLDVVNTFSLTQAQKEELAQRSKLRVLLVDQDAPYAYEKDGEPQGALVLAIEEFASKTGLTTQYTFCKSREGIRQALADGEYDFMIGLPFTSAVCAENGWIRSESVFSAGISLVRSQGAEDYGKETAAVVEGLENTFDASIFQKVKLFDTAAECLTAVKKGEADVAAGDRSVMDYYIYESGGTMQTSDVSGKTHDVCIAVSKENAMPLLGILNRYLDSLSAYDRTIYLDAGNVHDQTMTIRRMIIQNPVASLFCVGVLAALAVGIALMILHSTVMSRKNQELAKATQAKSDFLSRMSHDIRTPLNGIIGLLKINETHFDDLQLLMKNQKEMTAAANHLLSLVNDVLQMSKLEDGTETMVNEPVSLEELSRDITAIIRHGAAENGITWKFGGDEKPRYPYIMASPLHLRQIFLNIYGNCIKFTEPGGEICTKQEFLGMENQVVTYRWTISDTGIGMSEEFLKHIFEPFTQEKTGARSKYQGTGLGMSIVKELVDRMHGTIAVSSREGIGSTFVITLPFTIAQPPEEQPQMETETIRGMRLLLVEDNQLNAEIAQILLKDEGAEVTMAWDGQQAVEKFYQEPAGTFDAILMDVMMPVMDGLTATRAIRSLERPDAKTIPIIAMTANAFAEDAQKCLDAGMNAHVAKPLDMTVLKRALQMAKKKT